MKLLYLQALVLVITLSSAGGAGIAADGCSDCHGDSEKMKALGFPGYAITDQEVLSQSGMKAACSDCHLGDPASPGKDEGHMGLQRLRAVRQKTWEAVTRDRMDASDLGGWPYLAPRGDKRSSQLMPKLAENGKIRDNPAFRTIIFHDKNPDTLAFNPVIAERTCGRCHGEIVKGFLRSPMGGAKGAHTQSQYTAWTGLSGPQSCGLWLGALSEPAQESFTPFNVRNFNSHSTTPIGEEAAFNMQRNCNTCHVGCLDCHLEVRERDGGAGNGPHVFVEKPQPLACYGGGRSFSCHAGPLERRRGDGYLRAEFTQASADGLPGLREKTDVHLKKNIVCVDCHEPDRAAGYHADLRRDVKCGRCHEAVTKEHAKGPHRKVDCASCHTALIGGYAFNFWTAVGANPATRIQDYLVGGIPPLIIRNPKGIWIPVHVVPHTSGNVKAGEVRLSGRLLFRNRPDSAVDRRYASNDSYAVTGLVRHVDERDKDVMVWLNLDRVAHATGKSRDCASCHGSVSQRVVVKFDGGSYKDVSDGEYTIVADSSGLRITGFKGPDGGPPASGLEPFMDKWALKGDFSLPAMKAVKLYEKIEKDYASGKFAHGK